MDRIDFSGMTVVQLRKFAREHGIALKSSMVKADIIEYLNRATGNPEENQIHFSDLDAGGPEFTGAPEAEKPRDPSPDLPGAEEETEEEAENESDEEEKPEESPASPPLPAPIPIRPGVTASQPTFFRAAWHNPSSGSGRPSGNAWQPQPQPRQSQDSYTRATQTRQTGYVHRFGPDSAREDPPASETRDTYQGFRSQPVFGPRRGDSPDRSAYSQDRNPYGQDRNAYSQPTRQAPRENQTWQSAYRDRSPYPADTRSREYSQDLPSISDLIQAEELRDGEGVFEGHPDGYGFLRTSTFLPSSRDIYVPVSLVRRHTLRTGDHVRGKLRPQRDGDKYVSLLYATEVNGASAATPGPRPLFDELTAVYPSHRLDLDAPAHPDIRLVDLITPVGMGQRALCLFPDGAEKIRFLISLMNAISDKNPEAACICLLLDRTPEDVTEFRAQTRCQVLASTFDQSPEIQLRLVDMVQERCQRLAENGKNVVLVVDSLTRLVKTYTISAAQAVRNASGTVNPASLFRAKKLFGSARALREGGSLTIFAAMDVDTGNRVDDSVVDEFRSSANLELVFDPAIIRQGVYPPLHILHSRARQSGSLLTQQEQEGRATLQDLLRQTPPAAAIQQLTALLNSIPTNREMLLKVKELAALMSGSGKA